MSGASADLVPQIDLGLRRTIRQEVQLDVVEAAENNRSRAGEVEEVWAVAAAACPVQGSLAFLPHAPALIDEPLHKIGPMRRFPLLMDGHGREKFDLNAHLGPTGIANVDVHV